AKRKQEYNNSVNERQMQSKEGKVDSSKELDASLAVTKCSGTKSEKQDTSSSSGNDADVDAADIELVYDEEPMAEVQLTADNNFAKSSILGKPILHLLRNQSVVRQPHAFKSERPKSSKSRFASQVDVNDDLLKPVTTHYLPRERESALVKPYHMIAPSSCRYSSNDMVHNHYLEEAKKKTQESDRNSRPSVTPLARSQSTTNGSISKPKINNQKSRNWPASKSSCTMTKTMPIAEHPRNSRSFSNFKHFVCSTCKKYVINASHDTCVTKFLNEVNSRAEVPSNKTINRNKPIEKISTTKKLERQIHRFSIKNNSTMYEKTTTPRSCLR
nr:actin-binding, cofilin/tropomyosin type [Tanacetum cinerariifolium]